jgi:oxygen-independent coproporphyrinogen-3 oxidase
MTSMNQFPPFDAELLKRYDRPGPRYTSYPTAPQFTPAFTERELREQARRGNQSSPPQPLSLYLHIPYCFAPCFYCGCNRIVTRDAERGAVYLRQLQTEIALTAPLFNRAREVEQLHLGGGTPNFLRPEQLGQLVACLGEHFNLSTGSGRDFSIELDPRSLQEGDVEQLAKIGFNRASLGVQDFAHQVQLAVNREQSVEQTLGVIDACRASGMRSVNVDLIYGLPRQTLEGFASTLETLLAVRPERFAIYGYAHMPHLFKAQRQIDPADLPDAQTKLQLLQLAIERLGAAGYRYIGMDHFAVPQDELSLAQERGSLHRNFMGYTTHADCDLIGLGVSAIGHIGNSFSQNFRDLPSWESAIEAGKLPLWRGLEIDQDDQIRAHVIQGLMCQGVIDMDALGARYGIDFPDYFAQALERLQPLLGDGLATLSGGRIEVTARGRLLLRVIAMCFDRHLPVATGAAADGQEKPRFSKVV